MRIPGIVWILPVAAVGGVAIVVAKNHVRAVAQSVALSQAHLKNLDLLRLQEENRRLESVQLSAGEREQLDARRAESEALRARLTSLQKDAAKPIPEDAEPARIFASDWTNAGRETPRSTLVSVLWSASRGDVDRLASLVGFAADVRAQADAMYSKLPPSAQQEYGSPEKVVATLLAGSFPKDASAVSILADMQRDQDAAITMSVDHSDGQVTNMYIFHHAPDGWHLMVPASVMSGYEKILLSDPQPAEAGAP